MWQQKRWREWERETYAYNTWRQSVIVLCLCSLAIKQKRQTIYTHTTQHAQHSSLAMGLVRLSESWAELRAEEVSQGEMGQARWASCIVVFSCSACCPIPKIPPELLQLFLGSLLCVSIFICRMQSYIFTTNVSQSIYQSINQYTTIVHI